MLLILIASIVFIYYVLNKKYIGTTVKCEITNHGFTYDNKMYYWNFLKQYFWFFDFLIL